MLVCPSNRLKDLLSHMIFPSLSNSSTRRMLVVFCFLLTTHFTNAQNVDSIRVATYNLLHYPDISSGAASAADTANRHPHFRNIISAINPDILVVEEVQSSTGFSWFLNGVMNANQSVYAGATFIWA